MKKFFLAIIITPMLIGAAHVKDTEGKEHVNDRRIICLIETIKDHTISMLEACNNTKAIKHPITQWAENPKYIMGGSEGYYYNNPLYRTREIHDYLSDLEDFFEIDPADGPPTAEILDFDQKVCVPIKKQLAKLRNTFPKRG